MPPIGGSGHVLIGAGDISQCALNGVVLTAALMARELQNAAATGFTLGDNSNDDGSAEAYKCFDRTWGAFKANLFPVAGNHDYDTDGRNPYYFDYFGASAGPRGYGFYAYDRGDWHIVALNSELPEELRQSQLNWLELDLRNHPNQCALAYFHRPLFSSGEFAADRMRRLWDVLYRHGIDVTANGHEHFYASFPPMAPDGSRDNAYGIRQIIAGTGGARLFDTPAPRYGERIIGGTWGVLRLVLGSGRYDWEFISVNNVALDAGSGVCHARPPIQ
jgi:hypothetical protein